MSDNPELIAERLLHAIDLLRSEMREKQLSAENELQLLKLNQEHFNHRIEQLEETDKDHESRIRGASEGVTQFRVWSGGAGIMSVVAFIKSIFVP